MSLDFQDLGHFALRDAPTQQAATSLKILQLTDLHRFPQNCRHWQGVSIPEASHSDGLELIDSLVRELRPDLVMLTGDIIDGRGPWAARESLLDPIRDIISVMHGTPWAFLPGNHDDDSSPWSRDDLIEILDLKNCIQKGAKGFNHTITVGRKSQPDFKVRLYLFDSGGNHPDPKIMYYTVTNEAVRGFRECTAALKDEALTGLAYMHIPLPEYANLEPVVGRNGLFEAALSANKVPRPWSLIPWFVRMIRKDRIVGCSRGHNPGLFAAMAEANSLGSNIRAVFTGHDHHSDAVFFRQGIFLAYGRCGSTSPPYDWEGKAPNPLSPGGRIVEVLQNGQLKTWIQLQDGVENNSFLEMTIQRPSEQSFSIWAVVLALLFALLAVLAVHRH